MSTQRRPRHRARPRSATTCAASGASPGRSPSPTGSCASSARRSATCGRSRARCCSSASSTSCSPRSSALGSDVPNYGVYILFGDRPVHVLRRGDRRRGAGSLVQRENLLRKMRFPRLVIPLSVVADRALQPRLNLVAVFIFVARIGRLPALELAGAAAAGRAARRVRHRRRRCCSRALYVRYRDMQPIWEVVLQILFYASPCSTWRRWCPTAASGRTCATRSRRSSPRCATRSSTRTRRRGRR